MMTNIEKQILIHLLLKKIEQGGEQYELIYYTWDEIMNLIGGTEFSTKITLQELYKKELLGKSYHIGKYFSENDRSLYFLTCYGKHIASDLIKEFANTLK